MKITQKRRNFGLKKYLNRIKFKNFNTAYDWLGEKESTVKDVFRDKANKFANSTGGKALKVTAYDGFLPVAKAVNWTSQTLNPATSFINGGNALVTRGKNLDGTEFTPMDGLMLAVDAATLGKGSKVKGLLREAEEKLAKSCAKKAIGQACFIAGTPILYVGGVKKIEKIERGDTVWSYDEVNKRYGLKRVVQVYERETDKLVILYLSRDTIYTTPEHPFFVNSSWIPAGRLSLGDTVTTFFGEISVIQNIILKDTVCTVYNFEVEDFHTYFVGSGVLVHNTCFPDKKELAKMLNTTVDDFHKNLKRVIKKDHPEEMKKLNNTQNPDIGKSDDGFLLLRNPDTKIVIKTSTPFDLYIQE